MRHLLTLVFFGGLCWIIYLADTARTIYPFELLHDIPQGDKLGHFGLFGGLAWLLNRSLDFRRLQVGRFPLQLGAVLVMTFAAGEELTQWFFPNRHCDLADLLADLCGVVCFTLLQQRWNRHHSADSRVES